MPTPGGRCETHAALKAGDTIDASNCASYQAEVEQALTTVSAGLTSLGSMTNGFTSTEGVLEATRDNTEAAFSRIYNADLVEEQIAPPLRGHGHHESPERAQSPLQSGACLPLESASATVPVPRLRSSHRAWSRVSEREEGIPC